MLNFTVGPVQMSESIRNIGAKQIPYFRTSDFSEVMLENERMIKELANAPSNSRVVFITGSGTASMEACVMNTLTHKDRALVVNGGSFGKRFGQILSIHGIPHDEICLPPGAALREKHLEQIDGRDYTAFLVNLNETSTGVLYDLDLISSFCKKNNLFLIVDAISSFIADPLDMSSTGVDVMITGSQKALACPPGVSLMVLSPRAIQKTFLSTPMSMYFDMKEALINGERGQTPFTPAVGILLQINSRLHEIEDSGGAIGQIVRTETIAKDFRKKVKELPFDFFSETQSNAVTALHPCNCSAYDVFLTLKNEYNIWVCPNGGNLKDVVFRVGHIGNLSLEDNDALIEAFKDMFKRGLL